MLERELEVAVDAARSAGEAIRAVYDSEDFEVRQKADDRGPLTEADLAANRILIDHLQTAFPDDGLLSEETTDTPERLGRQRVWIIDPLDGTREFTLHIPEFVVSVGLAIDGVAKLGVLYNPATDELITGVVGLGATYNEQAVRATDHAGLSGARFLVSRSEHKKGWFDDYPDDITLTPMGSVAYKFGLVAAGRAEASFTPKPRSEWDLCAGVACIEAAGGRTSDKHGRPYRFNCPDPLVEGVCGTNGAIHDEILGLMRGR